MVLSRELKRLVIPESRNDTSPEKRVELHCHTKMSDMDGVSEVQEKYRQEPMTGDIRRLPSRIMEWFSPSRMPIIILKALIRTIRW